MTNSTIGNRKRYNAGIMQSIDYLMSRPSDLGLKMFDIEDFSHILFVIHYFSEWN